MFINFFNRYFEKVRDELLDFFIRFYNEVNIKFDKDKVENFFNK